MYLLALSHTYFATELLYMHGTVMYNIIANYRAVQ